MNKLRFKNILLIWFSWSVVLFLYLSIARTRLDLKGPDASFNWTSKITDPATQIDSRDDIQLKNEGWYQALKPHVSYDSFMYASIAMWGYHDPYMWAIPRDFSWDHPTDAQLYKSKPEWMPASSGFSPFYPYVSRLVSIPLIQLGNSPLVATLMASIAVSLVGTLISMFSLSMLGDSLFGSQVGNRAAFYLLIFPASVCLGAVYTEGLFLALSLTSLVLIRKEKVAWASILAAFAVWTRVLGVFLVIPILAYYMKDLKKFSEVKKKFTSNLGANVVIVVLPVLSFLIWKYFFGTDYELMQNRFHLRVPFTFSVSLKSVYDSTLAIFNAANPHTRVYQMLQIPVTVLSLVASVVLWKKDRGLSIYSLVMVLFPLTSGVLISMNRYVLACPALLLLPAKWSENAVFEKVWLLINILGLALYGALFASGYWVP